MKGEGMQHEVSSSAVIYLKEEQKEHHSVITANTNSLIIMLQVNQYKLLIHHTRQHTKVSFHPLMIPQSSAK